MGKRDPEAVAHSGPWTEHPKVLKARMAPFPLNPKMRVCVCVWGAGRKSSTTLKRWKFQHLWKSLPKRPRIADPPPMVSFRGSFGRSLDPAAEVCPPLYFSTKDSSVLSSARSGCPSWFFALYFLKKHPSTCVALVWKFFFFVLLYLPSPRSQAHVSRHPPPDWPESF